MKSLFLNTPLIEEHTTLLIKNIVLQAFRVLNILCLTSVERKLVFTSVVRKRYIFTTLINMYFISKAKKKSFCETISFKIDETLTYTYIYSFTTINTHMHHIGTLKRPLTIENLNVIITSVPEG